MRQCVHHPRASGAIGPCHWHPVHGRETVRANALPDPKRILRRQDAKVYREPSTKLQLYLDTASIPAVERWMTTGMFHGITCNPTILKRDGVKCTVKTLTEFAVSAFELGCKEVHLQAWGGSVAQMSSVAFDLAGIDPTRVVVKLPCTLEGIQAAALLRESNVRVNVTGLYAPPQVLVAQSVGAAYAAPYLGRMNDAYGGEQGFTQICEMQRIIDGCDAHMRLMVASVRDTHDMSRLAAQVECNNVDRKVMTMANTSRTAMGVTTFTISPTISAKLFTNAYTIDAVGEFEMAARDNGGEEDAAKDQQVTQDELLMRESVTQKSATKS